jgi:8-oxo-dGTP pyrophosphatase MutT (NUDIX family)
MVASPSSIPFRQRAAAYVLRALPGRPVAVLVLLHRDQPEAGVQIPGGGALPHETPSEAAVREAVEETGVRGVVFEEVLGNSLLRTPGMFEGVQLTTYCRLSTEDPRNTWDHTIVSSDGDHGLRMRCEFRPVESAALDWDHDCFLPQAVARHAALKG